MQGLRYKLCVLHVNYNYTVETPSNVIWGMLCIVAVVVVASVWRLNVIFTKWVNVGFYYVIISFLRNLWEVWLFWSLHEAIFTRG